MQAILCLSLMDKKMTAEIKKLEYSDCKIRRNKGSIVPPVRGGIKRRIFALFFAQLKLAAQHFVQYYLLIDYCRYSHS
ncbi:hypothetical protein OWV82_024153 [Melia azedarach]|uniref:Uncharacterized protein n=1 Tax=Melia azedarach TaxID=155640 RepID=A0ACC1WP07_MELAZ|nr:hypothetical protein OWV82_024153 [Melia azedarach]